MGIPPVLTWLDNEEVVKRCNKPPGGLNVKEYLKHDYDIWRLYHNLKEELPFAVESRWVQGHQDENDKGEKIHGPFLRVPQLNIKMDKYANTGREHNKEITIPKPLFDTTGMHLTDKDGKVIDDLHSYLLRQVNGNAMLTYYREKRGWSNYHFEKIDWEAMEMALKKASQTSRNRYMQIMHGWQNVGEQKEKIGLTDHTPRGTAAATLHLCPTGCGAKECQLHYVKCQHKAMAEHREEQIKKIQRKLLRLKTFPVLVHCVKACLKAVERGEDVDIEVTQLDGPHGTALWEALIEQEYIGYEAFLQGFVSKSWWKAQQIFWKEERIVVTKRLQNTWQRHFILSLLEYTRSNWMRRNEFLHGSQTEDTRKKTRERVKTKVKELYDSWGGTGTREEQKLFRVPLQQRLKRSTQNLEIWIDMAESSLRRHREKQIQLTMDEWLGSQTGDPHYP